MLTEHLYGTNIYYLDEIGYTKEAIIEKYNECLPYQNVAFKFNNITIETIDNGNYIKICEQDTEKDWVHTVKYDALKFKSLEDFVGLILNYSDEKVENEYEEDSIQALKHLIDRLSLGQKDIILLELLSKNLK